MNIPLAPTFFIGADSPTPPPPRFRRHCAGLEINNQSIFVLMYRNSSSRPYTAFCKRLGWGNPTYFVRRTVEYGTMRVILDGVQQLESPHPTRKKLALILRVSNIGHLSTARYHAVCPSFRENT